MAAADPTAQTPAPKTLNAAIGQQQQLVGEENKFTSDMGAKLDTVSKAESGMLSEFQDQLKALKDQAPKLPEIKPFQAPAQQDPAKAFGSFAGLLATLASFETKTPLTTSLNAMARG